MLLIVKSAKKINQTALFNCKNRKCKYLRKRLKTVITCTIYIPIIFLWPHFLQRLGMTVWVLELNKTI